MTVNANAAEYKSLIGLDQIYVALMTADSAAAYTAGTPEILAPAVDIALTPVSSQETQYADNQPYDVFSSEAETDMVITLTGMPSEMEALILGSVFDVASGRVFNNGGTPPYVAIGFRALKSNGKYRYYWLQKVQFSPPEAGAVTKADKATPKTTQLNAKAIKTIYKWNLGSVTDSVKDVHGDEDTDNFSATGWFSQVQVPSVAAPSALALSSSDPTDGASSMAVTKTITLTFNNALPAGEIYHVVVTKADGTLKACTNSLDVTKKIMTVNPDTDFDASSTYIVAIGVTDIYGDTLQAVVNFGTA
jgi:phi13 family phage major tail protein